MRGHLRSTSLLTILARERQAEALLSELSFVELEHRRLLDDDSLRLMASLRSQEVLSDGDWAQITEFLRDALRCLSDKPTTAWRAEDGTLVIDPDADPRNADWLPILRARHSARRDLPAWAALWLWRLRPGSSPAFWRRVGLTARRLGYAELPKKEAD
jgi:hypothetical protein